MDLWIMGNETDGIVKAKRFKANFGSGVSRVESTIPDIDFITLNQISNLRDLLGYNIYLDDMGTVLDSVGIDVFEYQYVDLVNGQSYVAGVSAVYDEGESDIIEFSFTYTGLPINADFIGIPTNGYIPLEVNFIDQSSNNPISWEWDFENDGIIDSYIQNPAYTYSEAGIYTVLLTVSNGTNTDTEIKVNYITANEIIADFTADITLGYVPLQVQFTDLSQGNIIEWEWDFENDGLIDSYEQNPSFIYTQPGIYTVLLTVNDGFNTNIEIKDNYIIVNEASADFTADITLGYVPLQVQFIDLSQGNIIEWEWDFNNDGFIDSYIQNPTFTYIQPDFYSVALTIGDGIGQDTEIKENYITVFETLMADFSGTPTTGTNPLEVFFTDLSTGNIITWMWDFNNDGFIDSNEQNPVHIYEEVGVYTVYLKIMDSITESIEIKENYIEVTSTGITSDIIPLKTMLYNNYPNPFNPITTISFDIKEYETGTLRIFNIKGQLVESHRFESGKHNYLWDASNLGSGIYLYKLKAGDLQKVRKMVLLK
jgi:PKD repeat protein